jgi:hypothetical protein
MKYSCVICHKQLLIEEGYYNSFLNALVCEKCGEQFRLEKGFLEFNQIFLKREKFNYVRNSFVKDIEIKKIGSWRVGV